jgi:sec-independent protein translocase protein TatA
MERVLCRTDRYFARAVIAAEGQEIIMGALQPLHLFIVAGVVLLVFGPKKLPQLAKGIGESIRELKKTLHGVTDSEPVAAVKEIGQTVKEIKQELNPLAPPTPRQVAAVAPPTETPRTTTPATGGPEGSAPPQS